MVVFLKSVPNAFDRFQKKTRILICNLQEHNHLTPVWPLIWWMNISELWREVLVHFGKMTFDKFLPVISASPYC